MEMLFSKQNPKALHLDGLDTATKKVTIGFKCNPKVKLKLAHDASKYGLTLSEYIENLLLDLEGAKQTNGSEIAELNERLAFYENDILITLFEKYKGKEISFKNADGIDFEIKVKEPRDIYTIIINSFKIKK